MAVNSNLTSIFGVVWKVALLAGVLVGAKYSGDWVLGQLTPYLTPSTEPALHSLIMTATAVYILLMMLPFVPGVEIGLGMMMTFGPDIAPLVYASTLLALLLAFVIGRLVPQETIITMFETVRLKRTASLLRRLQPLDTNERLEFLLQNASHRIIPFLLRYRFLGLIIALNLPGNAVIGGGGGICMVVGFCRLFPFPGFILAVALAIAPVPLFVFFAV
jgi:hypothetical protein